MIILIKNALLIRNSGTWQTGWALQETMKIMSIVASIG